MASMTGDEFYTGEAAPFTEQQAGPWAEELLGADALPLSPPPGEDVNVAGWDGGARADLTPAGGSSFADGGGGNPPAAAAQAPYVVPETEGGIFEDEDGTPATAIMRFDPTTIKPDATVLLLGKRGTGKSTLLIDLMSYMESKLYAGIAMAPTQDSIDMFESFLPRALVFSDFNADAVGRLMNAKRLLSRMNKRKQKRATERGEAYTKRHIAVLLDDCMSDKKNLKHNEVRDVFMNGRHEDVFFVNLQQYLMDMGPELRAQIDYVFVMRDSSHDSRVKLWRNFFGMFGDYQDFADLLDSCTENYECLVLNTRVQSNKFQDCIFWYKARLPAPEFRIGAPAMWYLNYKFGMLPCDADRENEARIADEVNKTFFGETVDEAAERAERERADQDRLEQEALAKARKVAERKMVERKAREAVKRRLGRRKILKLGVNGTKLSGGDGGGVSGRNEGQAPQRTRAPSRGNDGAGTGPGAGRARAQLAAAQHRQGQQIDHRRRRQQQLQARQVQQRQQVPQAPRVQLVNGRHAGARRFGGGRGTVAARQSLGAHALAAFEA